MNFTVTLIGIALAFAATGYVFFKLYRKNKALYKAEADKNRALNEEIDKLKKMEKVKNDARKETENKIDAVDALSGADRFNAINDVLSDNN